MSNAAGRSADRWHHNHVAHAGGGVLFPPIRLSSRRPEIGRDSGQEKSGAKIFGRNISVALRFANLANLKDHDPTAAHRRRPGPEPAATAAERKEDHFRHCSVTFAHLLAN